jgi:hypothetical protein
LRELVAVYLVKSRQDVDTDVSQKELDGLRTFALNESTPESFSVGEYGDDDDWF